MEREALAHAVNDAVRKLNRVMADAVHNGLDVRVTLKIKEGLNRPPVGEGDKEKLPIIVARVYEQL